MTNRLVSRRSFMAVSAMTAAAAALDWKKISAHAAKMGPSHAYPTVVIGAGLGGLTCAAYLARQGLPVTVLERHHVPGGYATAFSRAGGKFTFEVSLHGTSIHQNAAARILSEVGVLDIDNRTPVRGLYLAGAWGSPGGGYTGVLPIEIRSASRVTTADAKGLEVFLDEYPDLADGGLLLYTGEQVFPLTRRVLAVPCWITLDPQAGHEQAGRRPALVLSPSGDR